MSHKVDWPLPLTRLKPWYPGQMGVPGTDNRTGLRTNTEAAVFYVDPNAVGVSDARDGTDPENPLATVGAALSRVQPFRGDTIAVMPNNAWQYGRPADGRVLPISEEVIVTIPGIRIVGLNTPGSNGVLWTPASNGGTCITVRALDVLIEGFMFSEGAFAGCDAISAIWDGLTAWGDNLTVRNCIFDDTVDTAIQLEFSWYCQIYENTFWQCDAYGIYVDPAGSGAAFLHIFDNQFHNVTTGAMSLTNVDDSQIFGNSLYNANAVAGAAAANEGINLTGGVNDQVFDNYFSCLLTVPANGDYSDLNTSNATSAWVNNHCMNGDAVTQP